MGDEITDIAEKKVVNVQTHLIKINGSEWYKGSFTMLCAVFFFLVGLFSGLTVN